MFGEPVESKSEVSSQEIDDLLFALLDSAQSKTQNSEVLTVLEELLNTRRICDAEFSSSVISKIFDLIKFCFKTEIDAAIRTRSRLLFNGLVRLPEFGFDIASLCLTREVLFALLDRFEVGVNDEKVFLRETLFWFYSSFPTHRPKMREKIGLIIFQYGHTFSKKVHIKELLEVICQIVNGMKVPLTNANTDFLLRGLLPLHKSNAMYEWRDQIPILELYHEPLVIAILKLLELDSSLLPEVLTELIASWPEGFESNTPKEVLLLHEVEMILRQASPEQFALIIPDLLPRLVHCLSVENSRIVQRALFMWKDHAFLELVNSQISFMIEPIMIALLRGGEPFWNPTVNKMVAHVLEQLENVNPDLFASTCEKLWGKELVKPIKVDSDSPEFTKSALPPRASSRILPPKKLQSATSTTLHDNGWRPGKKDSTPPLTVTGVAPWALKPISTPPAQPQRSAKPERENVTSGLDRIHKFIQRLKPDEKGTEADKTSWHTAQLQTTQTYLPSLRFHDLVFGQELGHGTFSSVKYARKITMGMPRSSWPEYAVKTISAASLHEHQYASSAKNEVAILRLLSHPGVARMVSSFRWHGGVYLVLEYAPNGDLHTHIVHHGSLDEECTRFVLGQVIAALTAVHDIGFVYGDLKPENVVITQSGHIKLTDFGACRPASENARKVLNESLVSLKNLRDGDWRSAAGVPISDDASMVIDVAEDDYCEDDEESLVNIDRVEGTAAYLAPEVAKGISPPTYLSDAWALGCLLYNCMAGRPPVVADTDTEAMAAVVRFAESENVLSLPETSSKSVGDLMLSLMNRDVNMRLSVYGAAHHSFFVDANLDPYQCYKMKPVEFKMGGVLPAPKTAAWTRRQNSMIWAPMPSEYKYEESKESALCTVTETELEALCYWLQPMLGGVHGGFQPPLPPKRTFLGNMPRVAER